MYGYIRFCKQQVLEIKERYFDRDLDWLAFNERVLQEAANSTNPLYERIKFLAIFSSNLDEFFRVRVSKLRQIRKVEKSVRKPLALKPNKLLKRILKEVDSQQEQFGTIYREQILPGLGTNGIALLDFDDCTAIQKAHLVDLFRDMIQPRITIMDGDTLNRDNFEDGTLYLTVRFEAEEGLAFLSVPAKELGRFLSLPTKPGRYEYIFLEDVIRGFAQRLFSHRKVVATYSIKVSRDAELYLEDDYEGDWIRQIYDSLNKRQDGQPTRLLFEGTMPGEVQHQVRKLLGIGKVDMVKGGAHHNFSDFFAFPNPLGYPCLEYKPLPPLTHQDFENCPDIFALLSAGDRILHFPYQSFGYLEQWVRQAAFDVDVSSINISLYRIAKDSALTTALLNALERKKEVTIFVEAKARFDEENNLLWGRTFEEKGAKVFYSFPNVKVHSKIMLIERRESGQPRGYAYIGTGNFNANTSKIYCDHALFTASEKITADIKQVFRVLRREVVVPKLKHLLVSPYNSRLSFEHFIQYEIDQALRGLPSGITAKMNSLEDKKMIDWLYKASKAGVPVRLLVRGFCCLRPQVPGLSENIVVTSIVDRFLEHGRVFIFHNQGDERMYMGSADWMTRNLDKRIEVLAPVLDKELFEELRQMMNLQLTDTVKARIRDAQGNNTYAMPGKGEAVRSQYAIYDYLRGKSLSHG